MMNSIIHCNLNWWVSQPSVRFRGYCNTNHGFLFPGDTSSSTVQIETLPCTKYNSVCQANVVLTRRLEPGRYYDFQVSVKDTKGGTAMQSCSITATNFTTPHDIIFPHKTGIIMVSEVSVAIREWKAKAFIFLFFIFIRLHVCTVHWKHGKC